MYSRFLPDLTYAINKALTYALEMTKNTYGNKAQNLDTRLFRQSIAVYIKHIHGIRDDDFLYEHVNKTLSV